MVRNRLRRRLRAVVGELAGADTLVNGLYLFGVHQSAADATFDQLKDDVTHVADRIKASASRA